jgi:hypothetical protein
MQHQKPTLKNLKKVVRKAYEPEPYARFIVRRISILFTWLFVRTPITANQVTILQIILGILGAVLLGFGTFPHLLVGVVLLQLGYILDCTDGEVARWKQQHSINGVFLDLIGHVIVIPAYMFSLGFGIWMKTGRLEAIIAGFLSALFVVKIERNTTLSIVDTLIKESENPQYDFRKLQNRIDNLDGKYDPGSVGGIGRRSWMQIPFRYPESMNIITLFILAEFLLNNINMILTYPLTYYLVVIFGFGITFGRIIQIRKVVKNDIVGKRFLDIMKTASQLRNNQNNRN